MLCCKLKGSPNVTIHLNIGCLCANCISHSFLIKNFHEVLSDQETILKEVKSFYTKLYSLKPVQDIDLEYLKKEAVILDHNVTSGLEGKITVEEVKKP